LESSEIGGGGHIGGQLIYALAVAAAIAVAASNWLKDGIFLLNSKIKFYTKWFSCI
jgi:hypothetical protein